MENGSLRFAEAARVLADAARAQGLLAPAYRSPPRVEGDRSIRRRVDGGATIAVRFRGRPWPAVLADMVEGVVVANGVDGREADGVRTAMWAAIEASGHLGSAPGAGASEPAGPRVAATVRPLARVA